MQDEINDVIDTTASDYLESEIPSKLWDKVSQNLKGLITAQVERKNGSRWNTLKKRLRYGANGPPDNITVEDICTALIQIVEQDVEEGGHDAQYRAKLTVKDPDHPRGKTRFAPIRVEIGADGEISIYDAEDFSDREHLKLLVSVIDKQTVRADAIFERTLQMMDKNIELADKLGDMAVKNADGVSEVGRSLGTVVKASTGALEAAAKLFQDREAESTAVQLAKLDQQVEMQKLGAVMGLLSKVGGPLAAQIAATLAGKKVAPETSRTAAAIAASQEPAERPETPVPESTDHPQLPASAPKAGDPAPEGICMRFKAWTALLTPEHKAGMKEIIGTAHFDKFLTAANDAETWEQCCNFKADFDRRSEINQAEIFGKLVQLSNLLGEELTDAFSGFLPSTEEPAPE